MRLFFTNQIGERISDFIVLFLSIVSYEQYDVKHPVKRSFIRIIMHNRVPNRILHLSMSLKKLVFSCRGIIIQKLFYD